MGFREDLDRDIRAQLNRVKGPGAADEYFRNRDAEHERIQRQNELRDQQAEEERRRKQAAQAEKKRLRREKIEKWKFENVCSRCNTNFVRKTFCPKCKTPRDWPLDNPWGGYSILFVVLFLGVSSLLLPISPYFMGLIIPLFVFLGAKLNPIFVRTAENESKEYLRWFDFDEIRPDFDKLQNLLAEQKREVYQRELENLINELNKVKEKVLHYESVLFHFKKETILSKVQEAQNAIQNPSNQEIEREIIRKQLSDLISIKDKIEKIESFFRAYENQKKCFISNLQLLQMKFLDGNFAGEENLLQNTLDEINSLNQIIERVEKNE